MAETFYPFDTGAGSVVRAEEWRRMIGPYGPDGVVLGQRGEADGLAVSADGTTMVLKVAPGAATVRGVHYESDATINVTVASNTAGKLRIDRVAVRLDTNAQRAQVVRLAGTPGDKPAPPTLSRGEQGMWDLSLAQVRVAAGAGAITAADLTPDRILVGQGVPQQEHPVFHAQGRRGMVSVIRDTPAIGMLDSDATTWSVVADMGTLRGSARVEITPPITSGTAQMWWRLVGKDVAHVTFTIYNAVEYVGPGGVFRVALPCRAFGGATQTLHGIARNDSGYFQNARPVLLLIEPGDRYGQLWIGSPETLNDFDTIWKLQGETDIHISGTYLVDANSIKILDPSA